MTTKKKSTTKRDLEFLYEIGTLRNVPRGWRQHFGIQCASVLEHTVRVQLLALVLARMEGVKDEGKVLKMTLFSDLSEARVSDLSYVQKVYVKDDEEMAVRESLSGSVFETIFKDIHKEYKERKSAEAKIAKDADNLDIDIELREFEDMGHQLPKRWRKIRRMIRDEKLYTKSAKKLWDEIQKSDPQSWHMTINKWLRIPSAGK